MTTYFEKAGDHTEEVLELAKKRAEELGIRDIVVASTTGRTGARASEVFRGYNLVVVTHQFGYKDPGTNELLEEHRKEIEKNGGRILTCTHAFLGVERAIRKSMNTAYPVEVMAQALRMFGQGTKVAVEIAAMAADAGMIPHDRDVICIAGTGKGVDTALVIRPENSLRIFDLFVREIIAKPRDK
ncbi:MAG: pyruvate kinase alpha/beta domain-containing protein [Candidatus Hadarchaeales archaeon]